MYEWKYVQFKHSVTLFYLLIIGQMFFELDAIKNSFCHRLKCGNNSV